MVNGGQWLVRHRSLNKTTAGVLDGAPAALSVISDETLEKISGEPLRGERQHCQPELGIRRWWAWR